MIVSSAGINACLQERELSEDLKNMQRDVDVIKAELGRVQVSPLEDGDG